MDGLEWRERDGKRYLRMEYRAVPTLEARLAMTRDAEQQLVAAGPGQRFLVDVHDLSGAEIAELARDGLAAYRRVHLPNRTRIAGVGLSRSAALVLRSFYAIGARGRMAGFEDEAPALDWLLSH